MSWLGRLFGRPAEAPIDPHTVVVPADLAAALTAGGVSLADAVEQALRDHLTNEESRRRALDDREQRIPFWLAREGDQRGDIEEELRDRLAQRRAAEDAADDATPSRRAEAGRIRPRPPDR